MDLKDEIKKRLRAAGAVTVGMAEAQEVEAGVAGAYERWLEAGMHAGMAFMERNRDIRRDPRLLLPGARSVISMAFDYRREEKRDRRLPRISAYAYLPDYHNWIKKAIRRSGVGELLGKEHEEWRICVDSAPIMERYWGVKSGIGFIGDNGSLTVPGIGGEVFLAEIVTTLKLESDEPCGLECSHCGACRRGCPTGALQSDGMIDCNRCISYLTIEHKGEWVEPEHRRAMMTEAGRDTLFGCDRCVCTGCRGRISIGDGDHAVKARGNYAGPGVLEWVLGLTKEQLREEDIDLSGSCLKRAGLEGLRRNAAD